MRVMLMVKSTPESEANPPTPEMMSEMNKLNQELIHRGILLGAEGLLPSAKGARVEFAGGKARVIDGPFTEAKELVGGYWILKVESLAEAIEWAKRVPFEDGQIEIRQLGEMDDYPDAPPDVRESELAMRAKWSGDPKPT